MNVLDRRRSAIWSIFTRDDDAQTATCTKCHKKLSSGSVSNLKKHWQRKHGKNDKADTSDTSDGECGNNRFFDCVKDDMPGKVVSAEMTSDGKVWKDKTLIPSNWNKDLRMVDKEASNQERHSKSKSTWEFYDSILDSDKFIAKCKVCEKEVPYETMADLKTHAKEHDDNVSGDEEIIQRNTSKESSAKKPKLFNRRSMIWRYMEVINEEEMLAACKLCRVTLSFVSSVSNLRKHLRRQHPKTALEENTNAKKLLIGADGQFYEIEESSDVEKDPFETDDLINETLDDSIADHEYEKQPIPPKKRAKLNLKSIKRENFSKIPKNTYDNNSSDENTPTQNTSYKRRTSNTNNIEMDSIDYFSQYLTSLLKQLPKHISDQLQSDIIKQVITTKITLETASYSVDNKTVTVTINNGNSTSFSEIPVTNTSDTMATIPDAVREISIDNAGPSIPEINISKSMG